jgi:hypothetical protein
VPLHDSRTYLEAMNDILAAIIGTDAAQGSFSSRVSHILSNGSAEGQYAALMDVNALLCRIWEVILVPFLICKLCTAVWKEKAFAARCTL